MYRLLALIIGILFTTKGAVTMAQGPSFLHYGTEEGLPSNTVYSITKDNRGFLWFATDRGIARFNGLTFERFSTFNGLVDNEIFNIAKDCEDRLWLIPYNGKFCFYKDGKFHTETNTPFLKQRFQVPPLMTYQLKDSAMAFTYPFMDKYVIVKGNELRVINVKFNYTNGRKDSVRSLLVRSASTYDMVLEDKIVTKDTAGNVLATRMFRTKYSFHYPEEFNWYLVSNNALYTLDEKFLFTLPEILKTRTLLLRILKIKEDYFLCTKKGLLINGKTWLLRDKQVTNIVLDASGNYWISTLKHGVYKMSHDFTAIRGFNDVYDGPLVLARAFPNYLFMITGNRKSLSWVETNSPELSVHSAGAGEKARKMPDLKQERFLFFYNSGFDSVATWILSNGYLTNFAISSRHTWVNNAFSEGDFYSLVNYNNIVRFKYSAGGKITGGNIKQTFLNNSYPKIFSSALDDRGFIWCATINSVYKVKEGEVYPLDQYKSGFRHIGVLGKYLVAVTEENKLLICNNVGDKVYIDTARETDCIWEKIYRIDSNRAIINTNDYYRLLTVKASDEKPDFSISIIENQFIPQQAETICFNKNDCYFLKNGSVTVIALEQLIKALPDPKVYIMSVNTEKGRYSVNRPVYISYKESSSVNIRFSPLSFERSKLTYEFSISKDGQDNWAPISTTELNLFNMGYGIHSVKVRVKGLTGRPAYDEFTLIVGRPYWAEWWFVTLCVIAVVAGMILVIWLISTRILKKRKEKFEAEIKFQTSEFKALNALMNPHFIFNSLNNIQGLINDDNKEAANQYLTIFSQLVRQNMHNISKELISVEREMTLVTNYLHLERLRFKSHLNFFIDIEDGLDLQEIFIPPLLIQPIVENAVKHGILPQQSEESYVHIRLSEQENELRVEVEDNGVGITYARQTKSTLHESTGIDNIQKRIAHLKAIHNQDIFLTIEDRSDDEGVVIGTLATIRISLAML